jgi:hypothetical protein
MSASIDLAADRRKSPRRRVFKHGKALLNHNSSILDCIIRDVSDSGARIRVDHVSGLPVLFELRIVGEGAPRKVRVVWRSELQVGVEFLQ